MSFYEAASGCNGTALLSSVLVVSCVSVLILLQISFVAGTQPLL